MGQISVKTYATNGSLLNDNQQLDQSWGQAHNNAEASSSGDAIAAVKEAEWTDAIAADEVANANGRRASERKRKKTASRDA